MSHFIGIDLGTTNSAICSFNGETVSIYKSPNQEDVTPSAIFIDRRGNKYVGSRAYDNAPRNPDSAATLFKRIMGTNTPVRLTALNLTMTPEECSSEILRVLFGYLPEEIRNSSDVGTVITVPAAFNAAQKQATIAAAELAAIGKVALMQEPVAAVMSVMRQRRGDGIFLIYDFGGGTLDIALAESISGRVNLLAHGGIEMCGGRDFDRALTDNIVKPWLLENFDLPDNFSVDPAYRTLNRLASWAAEKAKIGLSARSETVISLPETEVGLCDRKGNEIYLDIPINRTQLDEMIAPKIDSSLNAARETIEKAGLSPHDIERIVFVGGPTHYKPLRDKVAFELGIAASTEVNPMIAVAEGAALFAESIDWASQSRGRKNSRGSISASESLNITFAFLARVPDVRTKVVASIKGTPLPGAEFQIDSLETGWSSGRISLKDAASVDVPLSKSGENPFKIFVFDAAGGPIKLAQDRITITRTAANIDAIPASHSIGIEIREKLHGRPILDYLVNEGERLPKKGRKIYKTEESLKAGSPGSIKFKLWEGEIKDTVLDNRFVGLFEITGRDLSEGVIMAGAELVCEYEIKDSGSIQIEVSVPSIGGLFHSDRNFFAYQDGQIDYTKAAKRISDEAVNTGQRLDDIESKVNDPRLDQARQRVNSAATVRDGESDPERAKEAMDDLQEAKRLLALARKDNLKEIRQLELENTLGLFDRLVRPHARPAEESAFDNLVITAKRAIESKSQDFEGYLSELRGKNFEILWRQDWFVVDRFKSRVDMPHLFHDELEHAALVEIGVKAMNDGDIDKLRNIVYRMDRNKIGMSGADDMLATTNILKG